MRRGVLPLVLALTLSACGGGGPATAHGPAVERALVRIRTDHGPLELPSIEVARTPEARARGLMGRTSIPANGGMVFLFDAPTQGTFWMKDTLIPLSIAFLDGSGRIVDILDMQPCAADPCTLYRPSSSYVAALEVNLGFFERNGVTIGDHVDVELLNR